jgi:quercetin dioxygenase-like cupin family protein
VCAKEKNNIRLVVDPESVDEYEASEPYQRFMKVLIDGDVFPDAPLCMTSVTYPPGAKCLPHFHETAVEVYFVLSGELTATVERERYVIHEGQLIYIPPGRKHFAENQESKTCRFIAIHVPRVEDVIQVKKKWMKASPQAK